MSTPKLTHILWDWNGTLLDDGMLCARINSEMLVELGRPSLSFERYRDIFCFPLPDFYEQAGYPLERLPFDQLGAEYMRRYEIEKYACPLQEGTHQILTWCKQSGFSQSILSAYLQASLEVTIAHYDIGHFFNRLAGHGHIYPASKTEDGFKLLQALGAAPDQTVLIGDTVHDAEVAAELGIHGVLVSHGHNSRERLQRTGCHVVSCLHDLIPILSAAITARS